MLKDQELKETPLFMKIHINEINFRPTLEKCEFSVC